VTGWERVTATSASNSVNKTVSVDCGSGKVVLGGGSSVAGSVDVFASSYPVDSNTWEASGSEANQENGDWTVTVYAICADG